MSQYAVPLGSIVRPGLFLIVLWSLALDTFVRLHREVKSVRPLARLGKSEPLFVPEAAEVGA
jgi:hypothetical protein